jgi:hypothetical protein
MFIESWLFDGFIVVSRDFFFWFFGESSSPEPLIKALGPFRIFSKIRGDQDAPPPVSTTPAANNRNTIRLLTP